MPSPIKTTYQYVQNWDEFLESVKALRRYSDETAKPRLALDVETYWLVPQLDEDTVPRPILNNGMYEGAVKTIQIGYPPDVEDFQYIFDIEFLEDGSFERRKEIGDLLRPILEKSIIFGQNLQYEFQFMWALYKIRLQHFRDVRFINAVLNAGNKSMRNNLGKLYDEYLDPHFFKAYTGMYQHEYESFKKRMQKSNWRGTLSSEQLVYAAHDASKLIFELYDRMTSTHEEKSIDAFIDKYESSNKFGQTVTNAIKLEWQLIPIFAMLELRGIQYDLNHHRGVVSFLEGEMDTHLKTVGKYLTRQVLKSNKKRGSARQEWFEDEVVNLNSPKQMVPALESLGIKLPNMQEETIEKACEEHDHEVMPAIRSYRKASSMLSKYGKKMPMYVRSTGRIHPSWHQMGGDAGIDTGRSSCTDPPLMTIPIRDEVAGRSTSELFRKPFIARPGYVFVDADYSQIEPRVMAYMCNDAKLKEIYKDDNDVDRHALTAKFMFGLDYLPTDDNDPYRKAGKEYNLGSSYGMGLAKSALKIERATKGRIKLSTEEMREKKDAYYGELIGLKRKTDEIAYQTGKLANDLQSLAPFLKNSRPIAVQFTEYGRPRRWVLQHVTSKDTFERGLADHAFLSKFAPKDGYFNTFSSVLSKISREAFNFVAGQGTAADIFKLALVYVQEELDKQGFDFNTEGIILVLHDEILLEVKEENLEKAKNILQSQMLRAAYEIIKDVFIKVNIKTGKDWSQSH
jgi:DNA polymerase I-like protein with 3'-5' exonuclease and polymerase domains